MAYPISATKLQTYSRCPRAYFYRYEDGIQSGGVFGSASLGLALHRTLEAIYQDWHYNEPLPPISWLHRCWEAQREGLTDKQTDEGWQILLDYYDQHMSSGKFQKPLATEGRIDAKLIAGGIEFKLIGRYDRLDALPDGGLVLIDYKSAKQPQRPEAGAVDIQLGLYAIAIEQRYSHSLKQMQLLYLRTGEVVTFEVTPEHRQKVNQIVAEMALRLLHDEDWQAHCGAGCDRCSYQIYCPAVTDSPEALPEPTGKRRSLQLSLGI